VQQIEFETSFGLLVASEQALVDALRELLVKEQSPSPEGLLEG
jgi:hypothetical protein